MGTLRSILLGNSCLVTVYRSSTMVAKAKVARKHIKLKIREGGSYIMVEW